MVYKIYKYLQCQLESQVWGSVNERGGAQSVLCQCVIHIHNGCPNGKSGNFSLIPLSVPVPFCPNEKLLSFSQGKNEPGTFWGLTLSQWILACWYGGGQLEPLKKPDPHCEVSIFVSFDIKMDSGNSWPKQNVIFPTTGELSFDRVSKKVWFEFENHFKVYYVHPLEMFNRERKAFSDLK